MSLELKVPNVGESIAEVQIGTWHKREGETFRRDEALVLLETDKTSLDIPAPVDGKLLRIVAKEGQTVRVGDVIAELEEGPVAASEAPAPSAAPTRSDTPKASPAPASGGAAGPASDAHVMPAAARLLAEHGLEASAVTATGPGGRLLKEDVERHVAGEAPPAATVPPAGAASADAPPAPAPEEAAPQTSGEGREEEVVPMSLLRKRIAQRLVGAQQEAALLTTFNEIDLSEVIALRRSYQEHFKKRYDVKLGFMSFFIKASIDALKRYPAINAEIRGTDIVFRNFQDVSIAIGGGKGLVVPVIRDADRLSFAEIEARIVDYAKRAKDGTLRMEELAGGTFTITNGGIYGSLLSTPIVNPPQSGILGLHKIEDRPVAVEGEVVIRPMMYVALSYDHRLVDGREAVSFLVRIKETIENPARLLLEV